jgi:hypothetical protein
VASLSQTNKSPKGGVCWISGLGLCWLLNALVGLVVCFLLLWILWSYPCLCARSSNSTCSLALASDTDITDIAGGPSIAYMAILYLPTVSPSSEKSRALASQRVDTL